MFKTMKNVFGVASALVLYLLMLAVPFALVIFLWSALFGVVYS
jgi:hypothetical protein